MRKEDLLEGLRLQAVRVLRACEVMHPGKPGLRLHFPSGDMKYKSFWVRDAAMMAESRLIDAREIKGWIGHIMDKGIHAGAELLLENGLSVPPYAVADHIHFEYGGVFFPGPDMGVKNQGNGTYGFHPPHCDSYFFIEMVHVYHDMTGDLSYVLGLLDLLEKVFQAYDIDKATQLCTSPYPAHTVDWGFCDTVVKSGSLLFSSLLRWRAALRLAGFFMEAGDDEKASSYREAAGVIRENILANFTDPSGWLLSATGHCRQKDVWGTAFALWLDILPELQKKAAAKALLAEYRRKRTIRHGYVRHIPEDEDFSEETAWEKASCLLGEYQNGGYWATPLGWVAHGVSLVDVNAAFGMLEDYLNHTLEFGDKGAPYEWKTADDTAASGCLYGTSATMPFLGLERIIHLPLCSP
ncbi:MAG: hypothetical protein R6W96_01295 [Clostridia bacterium]